MYVLSKSHSIYNILVITVFYMRKIKYFLHDNSLQFYTTNWKGEILDVAGPEDG